MYVWTTTVTSSQAENTQRIARKPFVIFYPRHKLNVNNWVSGDPYNVFVTQACLTIHPCSASGGWRLCLSIM